MTMEMEIVVRSATENHFREKLITRIEGMAGTMESMPWNFISTEDMEKLFTAVTGLSNLGQVKKFLV